MRTRIVLVLTCTTLAGCAPLTLSRHDIWMDRWGDRGAGVFARDHEACAEKVETRRSALAGCMQAKGWELPQ